MSKSQERLNITSEFVSEFETAIEIGREKYIVQTEDMGRGRHEVVTATYHKGEILTSTKTDYSSILKEPDFGDRLQHMMERQHKQAVKSVREERDKTPAEYLDNVKTLLRRKNSKAALHLLRDALESYPDDPFLLSYYGCFVSMVEKRHDEGVKICMRALERLQASVPFGEEFFYPVFYLNLGRAHLAGDNKKGAIKAFQEGLKADRKHPDLSWELKKLGERKSPPIPFLSRGNLLNKYIGLIRAKLKK